MKNILLALASFLVVSVLLLQVALAEELGADGFPVRGSANPPAAGENRYDEIKEPGNPKKMESNAFVPGGEDCTGCAPHVSNVGMRKDTKYVPRGAGTDADGNPTNTRGSR